MQQAGFAFKTAANAWPHSAKQAGDTTSKASYLDFGDAVTFIRRVGIGLAEY